MLSNYFNHKIPSSYYSLQIKEYIKKNYNFYKIDTIEEISLKIIFNLFLRESKYILIYKSPNQYPFLGYSYNNVINAIKILKDLNIVTENTGSRKLYKNNNKWEYKNYLTEIILNPVEEWNISKLNITWFNLVLNLYCYKIPQQNKSYYKIKKENSFYYKETNLPFIDSDLNFINDFLIKKNYPNLVYKRVFGNDFCSYGRFYNSFQRVPKKVRKKICEENNWIELDFKSCIINTLYIIETGDIYKGDIYEDILRKINLSLKFRNLLKTILSTALNTKNKNDAIKSIRFFLLKENLYDKKGITPEYLLSVFEEDKVLNKYLYKNSSSFTQNIESNCINKIMLHLIQDNILPISIHDCFLIPSVFKDKYINLMYKILKEECEFFKNFQFFYSKRLFLYFYKHRFIFKNCNTNFYIKKFYPFLTLFHIYVIMIRKWKTEYG